MFRWYDDIIIVLKTPAALPGFFICRKIQMQKIPQVWKNIPRENEIARGINSGWTILDKRSDILFSPMQTSRFSQVIFCYSRALLPRKISLAQFFLRMNQWTGFLDVCRANEAKPEGVVDWWSQSLFSVISAKLTKKINYEASIHYDYVTSHRPQGFFPGW